MVGCTEGSNKKEPESHVPGSPFELFCTLVAHRNEIKVAGPKDVQFKSMQAIVSYKYCILIFKFCCLQIIIRSSDGDSVVLDVNYKNNQTSHVTVDCSFRKSKQFNLITTATLQGAASCRTLTRFFDSITVKQYCGENCWRLLENNVITVSGYEKIFAKANVSKEPAVLRWELHILKVRRVRKHSTVTLFLILKLATNLTLFTLLCYRISQFLP